MSSSTLAFGLLCIAAAAGAASGPAQAAVDPAAPRFGIYEYEIEGNTVLPVAAVEAAVLPHMGETRQMSDVEQARDSLEKAYQQAGYLTVFVDIPEQRVDQGVVLLRVTEGRVERLRVTGSRYYSQGFIRERVPELAEGRVPDFNAVQRQLATLSRDERQLQPVLRPGRTPGTVEAELKVADQLPLEASVELNNRHAADTDPLRLSASLRYANLFQRDHALAITALTAPTATDQAKVLSATYSAPVGGDTLVGYAVASDSVVEPLGAATVTGKGVTFGLRWVRGWGDAQASYTAGAGIDYKRQRERTTADDVDALSTPVRYLPLQASFGANWYHERAQTAFSSTLVLAFREWLQRDVDCPGNVGRVDQFACKREGADGSFSYWRGDLRHSWTAGFAPGTLSARLGWQLSTEPLISAEQYALGGAETVRGYLEAEGSGDHALLGSFEWRSANLLAGAPRSRQSADAAEPPSFWSDLSVLGFVDVATAYLMQPSAGQSARTPLAGTGVGLRVRARPQLDAEVDLAWPLKTTRATPDRSPRVHVRLAAQF